MREITRGHHYGTQRIIYKLLDGLIYMTAEYLKTIIREVGLIVGQLLNILIVMVLHFFYKPGHYEQTATNRGKILEKRRNSFVLTTKKRPNLLSVARDRIHHIRSRSHSSDSPLFAQFNPKHRIKSLLAAENSMKRVSSSPELNNNSSYVSNVENLENTSNCVFNQVLDNSMKKYGVRLGTPVPSETPHEIEEKQKMEFEKDTDLCSSDSGDSLDEGVNNATLAIEEEAEDEVSAEEEEKKLTLANDVLSFIMRIVMIIWYIPSLFRAPQNRFHSSVRNDQVHLYEKKSTGLFHDIYFTVFEFIDSMAQATRSLIRLELYSYFQQVLASFALFRPSHFLSEEGIDDRSVAQVIKDEGFPYESHSCTTDDGYILHLDRIPKKESKKVVYFQHGILDSGFAWVGNGVSHSLALRAFATKGVDVFLGNFRGYGMSPYHMQKEERSKDDPESAQQEQVEEKKNYWDYSFNEHAFSDVRAFVDKIYEIKMKELNCDKEDIELIVIAHSMGAGSILAYLAHSGITKRPHNISKAILLAPAGNHFEIPFLARVFADLGIPILRRLFTYIGVTSRRKKVLFAKILQDLNSHPGLRALYTVITSQLMLGGEATDSPFQIVHNLPFQSFNGTSMKVVDHFIQLAKSNKFQAYDYGTPAQNMKHYGQPQPWNLSEHFKDINPMIPIHILMGKCDRVIPVANVMKHVNDLAKYHPKSFVHAKKFANVGHLELTYGSCNEIIRYVLRRIDH